MGIPKIIHQTFKTKNIPEDLEGYRRKLLAFHPTWDYRFYDDGECRKTVERHFSWLMPLYERAAIIQRTDIFRNIVVLAVGGFYIDMDLECLKPLDDLCEFHCVFGEEITLDKETMEKLGHRDSLRVANYMFGSEPRHPFLLYILRKMAEEFRGEIMTEDDVLDSTGPGLVTRVYHDCKDVLKDVVLLRNRDRTCPVTGAISCHFGNYGRHHHVGSWRFEQLVRNPDIDRADKGRIKKTELGMICAEVDKRFRKVTIPDSIYIMKTYTGDPYDGLSTVYHLSSRIGFVVEDTKDLKNKKVLVSGFPFSFTDRLSPRNTNVVYTTFESTTIPNFWVEAINRYYDSCIVPHPHVKGVFESSGVQVPVEVVHQGFTRYKRSYRELLQGDVFRIGFLGVPYNRKNLFKLYQACVNLLGKIPGLRLTVHAMTLHKEMYTPHVMLVKFSPFVEWTEGSLSEDDIAGWYGRLSCYVFPSSGEGWSFTPRESMYLGIPTALTDIPVHKDLTNSGYCRVIPVSGTEDASYEGKIYGEWGRVRVEDIENSIWDVYNNYGSNVIRGLQGSQWIENKWTNESSQQRILEFMRAL